MKTCAVCSKHFTSKIGVQKYCSVQCAGVARAKQVRTFQSAVTSACKTVKKNVRYKSCAICSKQFVASGVKKYCSEECSATAVVQYHHRILEKARRIRQERPRETARCHECGEMFEKQRWNQRFCGTECSKVSYEQRLEIRGIWR